MTLTKPRIMALLVLTSVCAMIAAAHGAPGAAPLIGLVVRRCSGLRRGERAQPCAGSRHRPADGPRTASRPVAAGRISPARATAFGLALTALAFAVLVVSTNLLAAMLSLSGGAFYVGVYTFWLKRATAQNIVIGGAAGALPPLAGWQRPTEPWPPVPVSCS